MSALMMAALLMFGAALGMVTRIPTRPEDVADLVITGGIFTVAGVILLILHRVIR